MASVTATDPAILADLIVDPPAPEHDPRAQAKQQAVKLLTANLTDAQRDVLQLRLEGFSLAHIARELNISVWSVRGRLERAHNSMRQQAVNHSRQIANLLGWDNAGVIQER